MTLISALARTRHGEVPVAWINAVVTTLASSPSGSIGLTEVLARGVIAAMTFAKCKIIAAFLFAAGLASTIVAWSVAEARPEATPVASAISVQESTSAKGATAAAKTSPTGHPVTGTIVDHEGKPAKGARAFYSAR